MTEKFVCGAAGSPKLTYRFYKNGKLLANGGNVRIEDNELTISNIRRSATADGYGDNAVYQCQASNTHGSIWTNFYLNILSFRPILLDPPTQKDAVVGQEITLSCAFFASPRPTVTWHREEPNRSLDQLVYAEVPVDDDNVARLKIQDASSAAVGRYYCRAKNPYGESEGSVNVRVLEATRVQG